MVFQMLNAANRDPAQFPDPARFDILRAPNRHLAFGRGIHFCIGAPLSRAEGDIVFRTILDRLPGIQLADTVPDWDVQKPNSRVLKTLPRDILSKPALETGLSISFLASLPCRQGDRGGTYQAGGVAGLGADCEYRLFGLLAGRRATRNCRGRRKRACG